MKQLSGAGFPGGEKGQICVIIYQNMALEIGSEHYE